MSYGNDVKRSILERSKKNCCKKAELYGYLICSRHFSEDEIVVCDNDQEVLEHFLKQVSVLLGKELKITINGTMYSCIISDKDVRRLSAKLGLRSEYDRINDSLFRNDCCTSAFLRGVFIGCGSLSDPRKRYVLEFKFVSAKVAESVENMLKRKNFEPGNFIRSGKTVLYIKSADQIRDFLSEIGALESMFDYTNTGILKELQNNVNRAVNCENANIDKSVRTLTEQRYAIRKLKENDYKGLSDDLQEIAEKRLISDCSSLEEFGHLFSPPISKSTICRKLKKICEISEQVCGKKGEAE